MKVDYKAIDNLDWSIRQDILDLPEDSDERPYSGDGFWYDLENKTDFIALLANEETRQKCYEAAAIVRKLERAIEDVVSWL